MNSATIVVSLFFAALSFPVFSQPLPDGYDIIAVYVDEDRGRRMVVDADGKTYDCGYTLIESASHCEKVLVSDPEVASLYEAMIREAAGAAFFNGGGCLVDERVFYEALGRVEERLYDWGSDLDRREEEAMGIYSEEIITRFATDNDDGTVTLRRVFDCN